MEEKVAILISDIPDFKGRKDTKDKEGHYIMNDKGVNFPETIIIQTPIVHASNHRAPNYEKKKKKTS